MSREISGKLNRLQGIYLSLMNSLRNATRVEAFDKTFAINITRKSSEENGWTETTYQKRFSAFRRRSRDDFICSFRSSVHFDTFQLYEWEACVVDWHVISKTLSYPMLPFSRFSPVCSHSPCLHMYMSNEVLNRFVYVINEGSVDDKFVNVFE